MECLAHTLYFTGLGKPIYDKEKHLYYQKFFIAKSKNLDNIVDFAQNFVLGTTEEGASSYLNSVKERLVDILGKPNAKSGKEFKDAEFVGIFLGNKLIVMSDVCKENFAYYDEFTSLVESFAY